MKRAFTLLRNRQGLALALLMFCTTLAYCVTRAIKEMVLLSQLGAAYLPVVNFFIVLPISVALGSWYVTCQHRFCTKSAYHFVSLGLFSYMFIYTFILAPNTFQIGILTQPLLDLDIFKSPSMTPFVSVLNAWPAVLYYASCELWGNFTLMVMFWQLANEIYTTDEAKELYPWFVTVSSVAMTSSFCLLKCISTASSPLISGLVIIGALSLMMNALVYFGCNANITPKASSSKKIAWTTMLALCIRSKEILYLASSVVLFYTLSNVLEVTLKEQVVKSLTNPVEYLTFMQDNLFYQGGALLLMSLIRLTLLPSLSWTITAAITPVFCIVFVNYYLLSLAGILPSIPLHGLQHYGIYFGLFSIITLKTMKYAFFDVAKEMFYIPMDASQRTQGKTVVDGMGARIGKSGYGVVQLILFYLTGHDQMMQLLPSIILMIAILSCCWIWVAFRLDKLYQANEEAIEDLPVPQQV